MRQHLAGMNLGSEVQSISLTLPSLFLFQTGSCYVDQADPQTQNYLSASAFCVLDNSEFEKRCLAKYNGISRGCRVFGFPNPHPQGGGGISERLASLTFQPPVSDVLI